METKRTRGHEGSALTMVVVAAGILSIILMAGLSIADRMRSQTAGVDSKLQTIRFANYLSTILEDPSMCTGLSGPGTGLGNFTTTATAATDTQFVSIPTNFSKSDGNCCIVVANGADVPAFKVHVEQFYLTNFSGPTASGVYRADAYVRLKDTQIGTVFNIQKLGSVYITTSGTSLATCQMQLAAQDVCEQMATPSISGPQNCKWMDASVTPRCRCNTPIADCTNAYGDGSGYVYGFNADGSVICQDASFQCGGGQFATGFDGSGNIQCVSASYAGPPP